MHFSIDRTVHTTAFDKPVVDHWLVSKQCSVMLGVIVADVTERGLYSNLQCYQIATFVILR